MAIFVVGMHRSGTSMVAAMLDALGVNFGPKEDLLPANGANIAGYYENKRILQINDKLAADNDLSWRTLPAINRKRRVEGVPAYLASIEKFATGFENTPLWGVKDPRLSFFLSYWKVAAPQASVIVCVRRPDAVAQSLNVRNDIAMPYGAALWELYTIAALKNSRRMPRVAVVYENLLKDPEAAVRQIINATPELSEIDFAPEQLRLAAERVRQDLDHSEHDGSQSDYVSDSQMRLYERLAAGTLSVSRADETAAISNELARLEAAHQAAKAAVERANTELATVRTTLEAQRADQKSFLTRVQDLVDISADAPTAEATPAAVFDGLRALARRLSHTPAGFVSEKAADERALAKDDQLAWYKSELQSVSDRLRKCLDDLYDARLEGVTLRSQIAEQRLAGERASAAESALAAARNDISEAHAEIARVQLNAQQAAASGAMQQEELKTLRAQNAKLKEDVSSARTTAEQAQESLSLIQAEARRLRALEVEFRGVALQAEQDLIDLNRKLSGNAEREDSARRNIASLKEEVSALETRLRLSANDLADARTREATLRTEFLTLQITLDATAADLRTLREESSAALIEVRAERDAARTESEAAIAALRETLAETEAAHRVAAGLATERDQALSLLKQQLVQAEQDRARKAAEILALTEAVAVAVEERDAARREGDGALAASQRAFADERDAALASMQQITAERDAALASAEQVRQEAEKTKTAERSNTASERAHAATRLALQNALQLVESLEREIGELKLRAPDESDAGASSEADRDTIKRLRAERDGLEKTLRDLRNAPPVSARPSDTPSSGVAPAVVVGPALDRLRRQLVAAQQIATVIDELLSPKVGGRFNIPVRKIRSKLVQLRSIIDIELEQTRQRPRPVDSKPKA